MKMNIENRVEEAVRLVSLANEQKTSLTSITTYGMMEELEGLRNKKEELDKKIEMAGSRVEKRGLRAYRSVISEEYYQLLEEYLSIEEFLSTVRAYERLYNSFSQLELEEFNRQIRLDRQA